MRQFIGQESWGKVSICTSFYLIAVYDKHLISSVDLKIYYCDFFFFVLSEEWMKAVLIIKCLL